MFFFRRIDSINLLMVLLTMFLTKYVFINSLEVAALKSSYIATKPIYWVIFLGILLILFLSTASLKKQLLGNLIISVLLTIPIYGIYLIDVVSGRLNGLTFGIPTIYTVSFYCFFVFITSFIIEIIKDIENINEDFKMKANTLPILLGRKRASKVAFFFSALLFVIILIVLQFLKNEFLFLGYGCVFMLLPLAYFMYQLWISESEKDFSKLSNLITSILLFGILSMLLFKLQ